MCPNCIRGLKDGEVCVQCAGTGFWNPNSSQLTVKGLGEPDMTNLGTISVPKVEKKEVKKGKK